MAGPTQRQKLDVETEEERQQRLGSLFTSLTSSEADSHAQAQTLPPSKPFAVPESDGSWGGIKLTTALARARAFLPLLAQSNAELLARADGGEDVGIDAALRREGGGEEGNAEEEEEHDDNDDEEDSDEDSDADDSSEEDHDATQDQTVVEMDVGLGVFDVNGQAAGDVGPVVERDASVWSTTDRKETS